MSEPINGNININSDWTVTYISNTDFNGIDHLTYKVQDNDRGLSNEAVVTVTVIEVNDTPIAYSQSLITEEDTPLSITLTGNDVDGDVLNYAYK